MGISLYGLTPATTYDALIKTGDNEPLTASLKVLSDGVGTNLPMEASTTGINFTGALQQSGVAVPTASQVAAKQDTLVSGTNIKTINGTSVLGSGNIVTPTTSPSGVAGAIQFSNGSAFASDAANLFWDDTNNRLGIGTNAPSATFQIQGSAGYQSVMNLSSLNYFDAVSHYFRDTSTNLKVQIGGSGQSLLVKGSGSTSATTSFLVQNSAGTEMFKVRDDGQIMLVSPSGLVTIAGTNELRIGTTGFAESFKVFFDGAVGLKSNAIYIDASNKVAMGTISPNASAKLQIDSTVSGFACPRMTTTQKNAIASPLAGLQVYDTTTNKLQCYNGSTWNDLF